MMENKKNRKKVKIMFCVKVLHLAGTEKVDISIILEKCVFLEKVLNFIKFLEFK